jgi:hypothetical protein
MTTTTKQNEIIFQALSLLAISTNNDLINASLSKDVEKYESSFCYLNQIKSLMENYSENGLRAYYDILDKGFIDLA